MSRAANPWDRLLTALGRRGAIRRILARLPARLRLDYGHIGPCTPEQVAASVRRHRVVAPRHIPWAIAIFCDREALKRLRLADPHGPDYEALRAEAGSGFISGGPDFTLRDLARFETAHGDPGAGHGEAPGHHGDCGGHGGDGGGGHH